MMSRSIHSYDVEIVRTVTCTTTGTVLASSEEEAMVLAATNDLDGEVVDVQQSKVLSVKVQDELAVDWDPARDR